MSLGGGHAARHTRLREPPDHEDRSRRGIRIEEGAKDAAGDLRPPRAMEAAGHQQQAQAEPVRGHAPAVARVPPGTPVKRMTTTTTTTTAAAEITSLFLALSVGPTNHREGVRSVPYGWAIAGCAPLRDTVMQTTMGRGWMASPAIYTLVGDFERSSLPTAGVALEERWRTIRNSTVVLLPHLLGPGGTATTVVVG